MFIDLAEIKIASGNGGDGRVAFRREKFVPKGGPAGGDGGRGGDVIFLADENLQTLLDFRYKKIYKAEDGQQGGTSNKDGKSGENIVIRVPVGTLIKNAANGEVVADMDENGKEIIAAKGGGGGKGNSKFATPTNQAPRHAEPGRPGKELDVVLELKLIADVGLVGFPNAGKSTFISAVSAARPKIADYPFTTLSPNLGIVNYKDYSTFTVADIPGIIEGAHEGKGLGHQFLRHIERTGILLILIDISSENIEEEYRVLMQELTKYSEVLSKKKKILALSKADIFPEEEIEKIRKKKIKGYDGDPLIFSSVSGYRLNEVLDLLWQNIRS